MKKLAIAVSAGLFAAPALARADLSECLKAAQQKQPGDIVKVEYLSKTVKGVPTYEIELRDAKAAGADIEYEFLCSAEDGKIYEMGREVASPSHELFKKAKVSEKDAIATATKKYKGEVFAVEYEIGSNGNPAYEIDIRDTGQKEHKVEIDAMTGKIMQDAVEEWQIGQETSERYSPGAAGKKTDPGTASGKVDETMSKDPPRPLPGKDSNPGPVAK